LLLVGLFFYSGLLGSLQTTAGQAYLMDASRRSGLGRASAGYFLGGTLGTALGSAAAGAFLGRSRGEYARPLGALFLWTTNIHHVSGFSALGAISTLLAV